MRLLFYLDGEDEVAKGVLQQLRVKLSQPFNLSKMPYSHARLVSVSRWLHVLELEISFPPFYLIGFLALGLGLFSWRSPLLLIPGALISLSGFLWLPLPYKVALRRLLRKKGFKGKVLFLSSRDFIGRLVDGSD